MVELRLNAGNVKNPNVHKIGIIALGSHLENHGPALPIDTDAKIASYIAFKAALESGAKFLGVIYPAHEIDEILACSVIVGRFDAVGDGVAVGISHAHAE